MKYLLALPILLLSVAAAAQLSTDSIHTLMLGNRRQIRQCFFSDHIDYVLIKRKGRKVIQLDSLITMKGDDLYMQPAIVYDSAANWCVFSSIDSGSGDTQQRTYYVRAEDDSLNVLLEFPAYQSVVDAESDPITIQWMELEVVSATQQQIVLKAEYTSGTISAEGEENIQRRLNDTAIFVYDRKTGKFVLKQFGNPRFERSWKGETLTDTGEL